MTNRITTANLEARIKWLNEITGNPATAYTKHIDGKLTANIGHYYLDGAYGGHRLVQIITEGGGIRVISNTGFDTKRNLYNWLNAFVGGIEYKKEVI